MAAGGRTRYINDLANALDSRQAFQAEVYLYELGKYRGKLESFIAICAARTPNVRAGMVRVLGNIGDPSSREQIQPLTQDTSIEVVREAVAALRKLNT